MFQSFRFPRAARLVFALILMLGCNQLPADEIGAKGREIFKNYRTAIATVQLTLKNKVTRQGAPGQTNETRQEATATFISSNGLAVMSYSASDPGQLLQNMMNPQDKRFKMDTEITSVALLLADGSILPAEIVHREMALDLAFVRPVTKPAGPVTFVDFSTSVEAEVLDQVVSLNRLGLVTDRAQAASVERISAIIAGPSRMYVPEASVTTTGLGSPAFTADGKPVGIFVMRSLRATGGTSTGMSGAASGIILPGASIAEAAKKVPAPAQK